MSTIKRNPRAASLRYRAKSVNRILRKLLNDDVSKHGRKTHLMRAMLSLYEGEQLFSANSDTICVAQSGRMGVDSRVASENDEYSKSTDGSARLMTEETRLAAITARSFFADPCLWEDSPDQRLSALKTVDGAPTVFHGTQEVGESIQKLAIQSGYPSKRQLVSDADQILNSAIALWIIVGDLRRCENYLLHELRTSRTFPSRKEFQKSLGALATWFFESFLPIAKDHRSTHSPDPVKVAVARRLEVIEQMGEGHSAEPELHEILADERESLKAAYPTEWNIYEELVDRRSQKEVKTSFNSLVRIGKQSIESLHTCLEWFATHRGDDLVEQSFLARLAIEEPILHQRFATWKTESESRGRLHDWQEVCEIMNIGPENPHGISRG